ncbi:unnamed protein product [Pylaiella littoralis]
MLSVELREAFDHFKSTLHHEIKSGTMTPKDHIALGTISECVQNMKQVVNTVTKPHRSLYEESETTIGKGFQGTVKDVKGHPDKVMKVMKMNTIRNYNGFINSSRIDKIASDGDFGPKIYEISSGGEIIGNTFPPFVANMKFTFVMEKLTEFDGKDLTDEDVVGIITVFKKMRKAGLLNMDGFFARSNSRNIILSADYGVVVNTIEDNVFVYNLWDYLESSDDFTPYIRVAFQRYREMFKDEEFTQSIIIPALTYTYAQVKALV